MVICPNCGNTFNPYAITTKKQIERRKAIIETIEQEKEISIRALYKKIPVRGYNKTYKTFKKDLEVLRTTGLIEIRTENNNNIIKTKG